MSSSPTTSSPGTSTRTGGSTSRRRAESGSRTHPVRGFRQQSDHRPERYGGRRGTALGDILGDGHLDLLAPDRENRLVWLENPLHSGLDPRTHPWTHHVISQAFVRTMMKVVDLNGDGRNDVMAASMRDDPGGGLTWFEAPPDPRTGAWIPHVIDPTTQWIHQGSIGVADLNLDGKIDLTFAEQEQSDQDRVGVFYGNKDDGSSFTMQVLARTGGHNPKLAPVGGDVLPSLLNANHGKFGQANPVELWRPVQPAFLTEHQVALAGLACSTVYHYRVVSLDRALNPARSSDGIFTTAPCPPDSTPPALGGITATASRTAAIVSWTTDEPATSEIEYGATTAYGATGGAVGPAASHALDLCGLTCATTYHYRVASTDHAGNRAVSDDRTFQTAACASAGGPSSDDFHALALNAALWTVVNPVGDGTIALDGTRLALSVPAGVSHDVWSGGNRSIRVMQPAVNGNFTLEAKFDSLVRFRSQMQGFLVEQDAGNYIRFDVYHDGGSPKFFSATFAGGTPTVRQNAPIPFTGSAIWLRVARTGNAWTASWSQDGSSYTVGAAFAHSLTVARVGLFAANHGTPVSQSPAFTASAITSEFPGSHPLKTGAGGQALSVAIEGEGMRIPTGRRTRAARRSSSRRRSGWGSPDGAARRMERSIGQPVDLQGQSVSAHSGRSTDATAQRISRTFARRSRPGPEDDGDGVGDV
jgi:hypothetical protein